uniref:Uncharacterized protein n=1 Tax=Arundo donax TaxID=35708 RepID=A0A0A9A7Y8_ARUDO
MKNFSQLGHFEMVFGFSSMRCYCLGRIVRKRAMCVIV